MTHCASLNLRNEIYMSCWLPFTIFHDFHLNTSQISTSFHLSYLTSVVIAFNFFFLLGESAHLFIDSHLGIYIIFVQTISSTEVQPEATPDTTSHGHEVNEKSVPTESDDAKDATLYPSGLKLVTILACVYATVFLVALVGFIPSTCQNQLFHDELTLDINRRIE